MPFSFISERLQKRVVLFLIKRFLGKYINHGISLESINLTPNGFSLTELEIDNELFDNMTPLGNLHSNKIINLEVSIPWDNLMEGSLTVHISKLEFELEYQHLIKPENFFQSLYFDLTQIDTYLQQSIIEDQMFLLGNEKTESDDPALGYIESAIIGFIENIKIEIDVIDLRIRLPTLDDTISFQTYGCLVTSIKDNTNINGDGTNNGTKIGNFKKRIFMDEFVFLINNKTVNSIQNLEINLENNQLQNDLSPANPSQKMTKIEFKLDHVYIYFNKTILTTLIRLINYYQSQTKLHQSSSQKSPGQIYLSGVVKAIKINLELTIDISLNCLCNQLFIYLEPPDKKDHLSQDSVDIFQKEIDLFPGKESTSPQQVIESILFTSQSIPENAKFHLHLDNLQIWEQDQDTANQLIKKINKTATTTEGDKENDNSWNETQYMLEISDAGHITDRFKIRIHPCLLNIDITMLNRYDPIVQLLNQLETVSSPKTTNIYHNYKTSRISCPLIQLVIKVPIDKETQQKLVQERKETRIHDAFYDEFLFIDIQKLWCQVKKNEVSLSCYKILGNVVSQHKVINFFSAKKAKKNEPIIIQIYNNTRFDKDKIAERLSWFTTSRVTIGNNDATLNQLPPEIDPLNKEIMKRSKMVVKCNLRYANIYLNDIYYSIIVDLIDKLSNWELPNPSIDSYYNLINLRVETLTVNISSESTTHSITNYQYTLLGEMLNLLVAMNFYTKHNFFYSQMKDAYLYNNLLKKIIIKKMDSRLPVVARFGFQTEFPMPNIQEIVTCLELSNLRLNIRHEELSSYNKDSFWIFDLINFFEPPSTSTNKKENTNLHFYLNINQLDIVYKIWNIPTNINICLNDIMMFNKTIEHCPDNIYHLIVDQIDIGLYTIEATIPILKNKFFNMIWKGSQTEITNNNLQFEFCVDTLNVLIGMITEFQKYNKVQSQKEQEPEEEEPGLTYNKAQLDDIEQMMREAVQEISVDSCQSQTLAGLSFNRNVSIYHNSQHLHYSYEKLSDMLYNSLLDGNNSCFIVKDFNIVGKFFTGLDIMGCRNEKRHLEVKCRKLNLIYFNNLDKKHTKVFSAIREFGITMIQNDKDEILVAEIPYQFRSWNLNSEDDIGLLTHIYSLSGGNKKASHFMDWSNHLNLIMSFDNDTSQLVPRSVNYHILVDIEPFHLNLNQDLINFILSFVSYQDETLDNYYRLDGDFVKVETEDLSDYSSVDDLIVEKSAEDIDISRITINKIDITFNYKSSVFDICWRNQSTILNFANLEETKIKMKSLQLQNITQSKMLYQQLTDHYYHQLTYNNRLNIISSLSPIKTVIKLGTGIINLVVIPSKEGIRNNRWQYGIRKGIENFKVNTLAEIANIAYKIVNVADKFVNYGRSENITITVPDNEYNAKNIGDIISNLTHVSRDVMKDIKTELKETKIKKREKELRMMEAYFDSQ